MDAQQFQDQNLKCRDCKTDFVFEAGEQAFFAEKGFTAPSRCKPCRQARKAQKDQQVAGAGPLPVSGPAQVAASYVEADTRKPPRNGGRRGGGSGRKNSRGFDFED